MKNNNSGFLKIILVVLIFVVCLSLIYYFKLINIPLSSSKTNYQDAVVYYENNKLYRFNFADLKKAEFEGNEVIKEGAKLFFNKDRDTFAVVNQTLEKDGYKTKVLIYDLSSLKLKSVIQDIRFFAIDFFNLEISPDGNKVAIIDFGGENMKIFENGKLIDEIKTMGIRDFKIQSWSPDSSKILYRSAKLDGKVPGEVAPYLTGTIDISDTKIMIYDLKSKSNTEVLLKDKFLKGSLSEDFSAYDKRVLWEENDKISFYNYDSETSLEKTSKWDISLKTLDYTKNKKFVNNMELISDKESKFISKKDNLIIYRNSKDLMLFNSDDKSMVKLKDLSSVPVDAPIAVIHWMEDKKSIFIQIFDEICGPNSCDKFKIDENLKGIHKMNIDGTGWEKIEVTPEFWF